MLKMPASEVTTTKEAATDNSTDPAQGLAPLKIKLRRVNPPVCRMEFS